MSLMPAVRASLAERFIFNFRLPMQVLASYLPISWLAPKRYEATAWRHFAFSIYVASPLPR